MKHGFVVHHDQAERPVYGSDAAHARCDQFWQAVWNYHVYHKGWSSIAYSFGICRHGIRYDGLGWDRDQFAGGADQQDDDITYRDRDWYSVLCFLGGDEEPTADMLHGLVLLVRDGRESRRCGNRVIPHNRVRKKPCPGPTLTAWANARDDQPLEPPPAPPSAVIAATKTKGKRMIWTCVESPTAKTSYLAIDGVVLSLARVDDLARWNLGTSMPNAGDVSIESHYVLLHGYCGGHARELAPGVWGR